MCKATPTDKYINYDYHNINMESQAQQIIDEAYTPQDQADINLSKVVGK